VRGLGVSRVMDSRTLDFAQETIAAGGVDVVLNSLSGEGIGAGMRTLRHRGRFVDIGRRDILGGSTLDLGLFAQGCTYSAYNPDVDGLAFEAAWGDVLRLLAQGAIGPLPVRAFDASEPSDAFAFMAHAHHIGKVTLARAGAERRSQQLARDVAVSAGEGITAAIGMRAIRSALAQPDAWLLVSQRQIVAPAEELIVAEHVLAAPSAGSAAVHERPALAYDFVPLEGQVQERIGAIWGALLGVDQVGAEDYFLDLGGDSLYATQAVARIRGELGVRVAPADLLGPLSLRMLAELVERQRTDAPLAEPAGATDGRGAQG
jgi:acyl carrier protein